MEKKKNLEKRETNYLAFQIGLSDHDQLLESMLVIFKREILQIFDAWTNFSSKNLEKLQLEIIEKPNLNVSIPSIPKNPWMIQDFRFGEGVRNRIDQRYLRGLDNTNYLSSHDPCSDKGKNSAKDRNKVILDPSSQFLFWLVDGH
ncbi:unnamed protein product [Rhizophagus irregularis]|nr:unnamed protein product [Rhizophagus irregularis]CAB5394416.1 unnamed protein product [Rhizophagus irregularis]